MAAPANIPANRVATVPGDKTKTTKKRAKASSPIHADLLRIRKISGMASAELTRVGGMEAPSADQCKRALSTYAALIQAAIGMAAAAVERE